MIKKSKIESINSIEGFLVFIFIILVLGILFLIGVKFLENTIIYNALVLSLIFFTILIASIGIFQFVKYTYIKALKNEIIDDLDKNNNKLDTKVNEISNRIFGFETSYSKKLKKITKEYFLKTKEINDIKRQLDAKLLELDRKAAYFEIQFCNMKIENIRSKGEDDASIKEIACLYDRIDKISSIYPDISEDIR